MKRNITLLLSLCLCVFTCLAQPSQTRRPADEQLKAETQASIERIYNYLHGCTPYFLADTEGNPWADSQNITEDTRFAKGDFIITTYEWGVTYTAMLRLNQVLSDEKFADYVYKRFNFLGKIYPTVKKNVNVLGPRNNLRYLEDPRFLDDCGAMCASMCKATLRDPKGSKQFRNLLEHWYDFVENKEYRLSDRILARNRPTTNSVWLDDMYMGIPPIAYRGALADAEGDKKMAKQCYVEALEQIMLFKKYLWVPEMNLYRHGWIEGMAEHPNYHWARANGWAVLTMSDVLDIVPENTPGWQEVMDQFKTTLQSLASFQSPNGLWHQLINRDETYLETSASAMYVYCIAHAINKGWLDRRAYIDVAKSGWRGLLTQINNRGQVENTCVGTGFGWTNTFYANRPVSVYAAHGYGPVLLAAAEIMKLLESNEK
jgi:rhamnogalacturonyl hydrolase YesR